MTLLNRRNFINSVLIAGASFNILPGNGRIWKVVSEYPKEIWVPVYVLKKNRKPFEPFGIVDLKVTFNSKQEELYYHSGLKPVLIFEDDVSLTI